MNSRRNNPATILYVMAVPLDWGADEDRRGLSLRRYPLVRTFNSVATSLNTNRNC